MAITLKVKGHDVLIDDEDYSKLNGYTLFINKHGYVVARTSNNMHFRLHNLIMGHADGMEVDHIDRNKLNNQKSNLRFAYHGQNMRNRDWGNPSQYNGIRYCDRYGFWRTRLTIRGKQVSSAYFLSEIDAARAYDDMVIKHNVDRNLLNFPDDWDGNKRIVHYKKPQTFSFKDVCNCFMEKHRHEVAVTYWFSTPEVTYGLGVNTDYIIVEVPPIARCWLSYDVRDVYQKLKQREANFQAASFCIL